jgi:hypothetical protein
MSKVGITKFAYNGSPKGIRHVWPEDIDLSPLPLWNWKPSNSQHKLTTKYNLDWLRKKQSIIDSM